MNVWFLMFQGICSAYDIILVCGVDPLQLLGLRKIKISGSSNGHANGNSKVFTLHFLMNSEFFCNVLEVI